MPSIRREEIIPNVLDAGDQITITVSNQIYIDGDQTWVTVKVAGRQDEEEASHDAVTRVNDVVQASMRLVVKETVKNVRSMSGQGQEN